VKHTIASELAYSQSASAVNDRQVQGGGSSNSAIVAQMCRQRFGLASLTAEVVCFRLTGRAIKQELSAGTSKAITAPAQLWRAHSGIDVHLTLPVVHVCYTTSGIGVAATRCG
jgi:hypothetical protein